MDEKSYQTVLEDLLKRVEEDKVKIDNIYMTLYAKAGNKISTILAFLHNKFNMLIKELNSSSKSKEDSSKPYLKAESSRKLIEAIKIKDDLIYISKDRIEIEFNNNYNKLLKDLSPQLKESGGSEIENYTEFNIISYEPIFLLKNIFTLGQIKNIIFASTGPKPEIVFDDALENNIRIVNNEEYCLVYDEEIPNSNLSIKDLKKWWENKSPNKILPRLLESIEDNVIEKMFFSIYYNHVYKKYATDDLPALLPQVYLHYDPKTIQELKGKKRLLNQRMDFLMLIKGNRIIVELDGVQHYSDENKNASPKKYADLVKYDRDMKLSGYDVYRFGGHEFTESDIENKIINFYNRILLKYYF